VQELQRYSPDGEGGMEVDSLGVYVKHQDVSNPPAAQPAPVPDLTHDQWDEWQNKHGLILEREALDELRSMLYTTPPTQPAPVWRYWKVKDRCVVTGPFTTTSKEEAYGPDCIDATPLTVPAAQPAVPLTEGQRSKMYRTAVLRGDSIMVRSDYELGISDAEAAHGITKGSAT
jgi:hypothetical protein